MWPFIQRPGPFSSGILCCVVLRCVTSGMFDANRKDFWRLLAGCCCGAVAPLALMGDQCHGCAVCTDGVHRWAGGCEVSSSNGGARCNNRREGLRKSKSKSAGTTKRMGKLHGRRCQERLRSEQGVRSERARERRLPRIPVTFTILEPVHSQSPEHAPPLLLLLPAACSLTNPPPQDVEPSLVSLLLLLPPQPTA
jgi:hypothetical protein